MSKLREFIKYTMPPAFVDAARWLRNRLTGRTFYEWEYVPEGWGAEKSNAKIKGWNVETIVERYKAKWPTFVEALRGTRPLGISHEANKPLRITLANHNMVVSYAYALALAAWQKSSVAMLDWGGGIGHYYLLSQALMPDLKVDYHCRDLPLLAQCGRELLPDAHFYDDDNCFSRQYDFVLASSSLQYSRDWQGTLRSLALATAGHLFVTRLPTVQTSASYVFVQRPYEYGYATEYLGWCLNQTEFLRAAKESGLWLLREFYIGSGNAPRGAPEPFEYRGFLFCRGNAR